MALRLATHLPRLVVVGLVLVAATATLAVGAAKRMSAVRAGSPAPVSAPTKVVPDVTGQAFVFAKGTLEDSGFAWQVKGGVHGYAVNEVVTQSPVAGTKLTDTGAPLIVVTLKRTTYAETGEPEDLSPYVGTAVTPVVTKLAVSPASTVARAPKTAKTSAPTSVKRKPAARTATSMKRTPDFKVSGAPKEPPKEIPLAQRSRRLASYIAHHAKSRAAVGHFLYQHTWVVTGAKFGWWHGAEALQELIAADRIAQKRWGIGRQSELVARTALAEVKARSR